MNSAVGRGVRSLSGPTRKPVDDASDEFPVGLRVLVVDDDPTCLKILERMLITCRYQVTKCNRVENALNVLRMNKTGFDVVISDVHMPNMDGFKLLEYVGLEMDLPVIMMSADDSKNVVMKGVKHGACDYLTKPVRMDALKNIWQHVVRKKKNEWQEHEPCERAQKYDANEDDWRSSKRKGDDEEADNRDDYAAFKKARVVWSVELHQLFVSAVNHLGIDKAVPKKILELMNVPGLTRENIASHLQKYRLCLRKLNVEPWGLAGLSSSFMGSPSSGFGTMPSFGGIDLQTLTGYQPVGISMPFHQTNALGLEASKLRVSELQRLPQHGNSNKPSCLPHGIPAAMELNQLTSFYQYADSLGSMNSHTYPQTSHSTPSLMQMVRPQTILSTGALVGDLPRNGLSDYNQGTSYTSLSLSSPVVDFSADHLPAFTGLIQEEANLNTKGSAGFDPSYDLFNELSQQEPHDWQIAGSSSGGVQPTSSIKPSFLGHQENQGHSGNHIDGNKNMLPTGPELQQGDNIQSVSNLLADNVSSSANPLELGQELSSASKHSFEFDQDDLLSIMLKQHEDIGPVEGEFNFDGYPLDDPLVGSILSDC